MEVTISLEQWVNILRNLLVSPRTVIHLQNRSDGSVRHELTLGESLGDYHQQEVVRQFLQPNPNPDDDIFLGSDGFVDLHSFIEIYHKTHLPEVRTYSLAGIMFILILLYVDDEISDPRDELPEDFTNHSDIANIITPILRELTPEILRCIRALEDVSSPLYPYRNVDNEFKLVHGFTHDQILVLRTNH